LIEYDIEENIQSCSDNLLRDGLYCYTPNGRIFSVTKVGIEPVTTADL